MWFLSRYLNRFVTRGELTVIDADGGAHRFGTADPDVKPVTIRFTDKGASGFVARNPRLGAGEAYMRGRLVVEQGDILDLVRLIRKNAPLERGGNIDPPGAMKKAIDRAAAAVSRLNWERRSKRNVAHHYDLSDNLYALFLDDQRQYSCAYFTDPSNSLEQAQADKLAHIAAKLHLHPGQRVLDIGCGWGGLALYLARNCDVEVLGVTLSEEQLKVAQYSAEAQGLSDKVRFALRDYRRVQGQFDRIVSIGMFEHVGPPNYGAFFRKCRNLLSEDGVMLLHTIGRLGKPGQTDAWTRKYIFPGGYSPSLSEIVTASEKVRLIATDVETLRIHYALTIAHWYKRVVASRDAIIALYDEDFYRMWQFYLAGAMTAFETGGMCNYQVQFTRRRDALPLTRDYIQADEARLRVLIDSRAPPG